MTSQSPQSPDEDFPLPTDEKETRMSQEAITWFAKIRSGPLPPHEQQAFDRWRTQTPAHTKAFHQIAVLWDAPALLDAARNLQPQSRFEMDMARRRLKLPQWTFPRIAAAVGAVLLLAGIAWQADLMTRFKADYYTLTGERRTIHLVDRSVVTMNALSAIEVNFTDTDRRIRLIKGKALFAVADNPNRPFIVEHDGFHVRAVGTEFIVGEQVDGLQVTVVEGLVDVGSTVTDWKPISLSADKHLDVVDGQVVSVRTVDSHAATAWVRGRLIVDAVPLEHLLNEVKPYHSGAILLLNADRGNLEVSGTYNLGDTDAILTTLSKTLPIQTLSLADRVTVFF